MAARLWHEARPTNPMAPPPLLLGSYTPPAVNRGDLVDCSYRQTLCQVIGWTSAPLPWPVVVRAEGRGGRGLWVEEALERAIRAETPAALMHRLGVSRRTVYLWRKRFKVKALPRPRKPTPAEHQAELNERASQD